ncbi:histidine kinase [Streptomyces sp. NPDC002766]|uniref:sensor histidine kinase n=1 Tax=unclassified Streptomyces TaxID=2593676 RepID=UPI003328C6D0
MLLFSLYDDVRNRLVLNPAVDAQPLAADWVPVGAGVVAVAMAVLGTVRGSQWVMRATLVACAGTFTATAAYRLLPSNLLTGETSGAEVVAEMILVAVAVRVLPPRRALVAAIALGVSVFSVPVLRDADAGGVSVAFPLALALAVTAGLVLRLYDAQQERTAQLVRQEERLALARDLHDTVAHQVTAIVVQAQAMRHVAGRGTPDPQALADVLGAIEHAGAEALVSMRRLVGSMRGEQAPRPPERLDEVLARIVAEARATGLPARLDLGGEQLGNVPAEVRGGLGRVLQEALTNAGRHARGARSVIVSARTAARRAELIVEDDGHGSASGQRGGLARLGGGFGVIGMRERIELLGGILEAGPRPEGGWRVRASVPVSIDESAQNPRSRWRHALRLQEDRTA